ncbi:MAG TPA: hypothetical protein VJ806_05175 [Luteimonas sp.]|nr:hypothetical protein [Luteimonas sp.]
MRTVVMILVGVELAALALIWLAALLGKSGSDLAGQGMATAYVAIGSVIALSLMAPAFAMAYYSKLPWLALILAVIAAVFVLAATVSSL